MNILDLNGTATGKANLPRQFTEEYRPDIIKRAVLALQTHRLQPHSVKIGAGSRHSAYISKRRHEYRTTYGRGAARCPAKTMSHAGAHFNRVGANVPQTRGGREAHPPCINKVIVEKINDKERKKAIRSALAATTIKQIVEARNHQIADIKELPIIIQDSFEKISKTSEVVKVLEALGLSAELERTKEKKVRAGRGKTRGRIYKKKTGPLIVVSKRSELLDSAKNIPGVDVVEVKKLNVELLAPGTQAGRLTVWTHAALKEMEEKKLFM
ncbi:MAG: 50S ribosomal protein L4 [Candidatus Nanoarchaeia archaeon]|nr:50S ribosomal protein L4 [Candidatus Nanoarchaeia archaeon]MDD5239671.1 50S ribosomal protein L4 [Candidatus Nanoarchaeia archaeon]